MTAYEDEQREEHDHELDQLEGERILEAIAHTDRENANLHRTVERLEQENEDLRDALEDGCEYHHLPLINGWTHELPSTGNYGRRCRLSEKARQALGGE